MARWIEGGCAFSPGISRSRAASTAARSSSKNAGRFIGWKMVRRGYVRRLRTFLGCRVKGHSGQLAAGFFEQDFHFTLGQFQVFLAVARKLHALFKQLHG